MGTAAGKRSDKRITVGGHKLSLTNLSKVFWPSENITKGDVIEYYGRISNTIIPYLKQRPQSLKRNPDGIRNKGFYHKDAGGQAPSWVKRVPILSERADKVIHYIICNNKATLLYLNNLGCIELNPWNSRISKPDRPDYLVLDLDPAEGNSFDLVVETALAVKEVLDRAGAVSYCKTSGATGLHVYVPLKARYPYEEVRAFAKLIATLTHRAMPGQTTLERSLSKRKGRLYLDYLQNKKGQTLAAAYCIRPVGGATVSTPLSWKEVRHGLDPRQFTIHNIETRIQKKGDLFCGVLEEGISLSACYKRLGVTRKKISGNENK